MENNNQIGFINAVGELLDLILITINYFVQVRGDQRGNRPTAPPQ